MAEVSSMDSALPDTTLSFRAYFIRTHGPEIDPTVRVLLVEISEAQPIYEGFGSLSQCGQLLPRKRNYDLPSDKTQ
jgi:hypothetical protein